MAESPLLSPTDKTTEELREEFLAVYEQAEKIRSKLAEIINRLAAHGFVFPASDSATTDTVEL